MTSWYLDNSTDLSMPDEEGWISIDDAYPSSNYYVRVLVHMKLECWQGFAKWEGCKWDGLEGKIPMYARNYKIMASTKYITHWKEVV